MHKFRKWCKRRRRPKISGPIGQVLHRTYDPQALGGIRRVGQLSHANLIDLSDLQGREEAARRAIMARESQAAYVPDHPVPEPEDLEGAALTMEEISEQLDNLEVAQARRNVMQRFPRQAPSGPSVIQPRPPRPAPRPPPPPEPYVFSPPPPGVITGLRHRWTGQLPGVIATPHQYPQLYREDDWDDDDEYCSDDDDVVSFGSSFRSSRGGSIRNSAAFGGSLPSVLAEPLQDDCDYDDDDATANAYL